VKVKDTLTLKNDFTADFQSEMDKVQLTLRKEDGLIRKLEVFNKDGKNITSTVFSQIKLGEDIDEKIFTYISAKDVFVNDGEAEAKKNHAEMEKEQQEENPTPVAPPETPGNF
jgi:outer membrane lipoprotein-sorting protein